MLKFHTQSIADLLKEIEKQLQKKEWENIIVTCLPFEKADQ